MSSSFRRLSWLSRWITPRSTDPDRAIRERAVYALLLPLLGLMILFLLGDTFFWLQGQLKIQDPLFDLLWVICLSGSWAMLRRGRLLESSMLLFGSTILIAAFYTYREGYHSINPLLLVISVIGAGLILSARAGFIAATLSTLVYAIMVLAEEQRWFVPAAAALTPFNSIVLLGIALYLLAGLAGVFAHWTTVLLREQATSLRRQMQAVQAADQEKGDLLRSLQEQMAAQERLLAQLRASTQTQTQMAQSLRQLASPVIPILDQVILLPVIGQVDVPRLARMADDLLGGIERANARLVILDITGAVGLDTEAAARLLQMIDAVGLLGAECVMVGIRPALAHTLIDLNLDLSQVTSRRDLQSGIEYALERTGRRMVSL